MNTQHPFVKLVAEMREAQKSYFAARRIGVDASLFLDKSKKFEHEVDRALKEMATELPLFKDQT